LAPAGAGQPQRSTVEYDVASRGSVRPLERGRPADAASLVIEVAPELGVDVLRGVILGVDLVLNQA
jgi:hypothetical protein